LTEVVWQEKGARFAMAIKNPETFSELCNYFNSIGEILMRHLRISFSAFHTKKELTSVSIMYTEHNIYYLLRKNEKNGKCV